MAKESKQIDPVITITPEQQREHDRRQEIAAKRDNKKVKDPNDSAKPAENPTSEPLSVVDTAAPAAVEPEKKKAATKRR